MLNSFSRTELLLGHPAMEALKHARVAVFGIGGVGGYACEALVRSGVGAFDLIDDDKVCLTNINRQIIATRRTVGQYKADVMRDRMLDINPQADIRVHRCFFLPENAAEFPFSEYDYILDAVDTVSAKLSLAVQAQAAGVPIISAMGAGNKLDGSRFRISDISETRVCPLARVMRRELKKRGVRRLKVVWSDEQPTRPLEDMANSCRYHCICPPCFAGPREQAASETASISAHSAEISFFISIILSSKIVKYVSECICSKPFYLFRRDFCASVPLILRFFFLGNTAQLQLRPSPNALAELCGAALVLTEKFYYNKGMFWKHLYGEDDCRVFFPGKTECARAARRAGGRGRAAERTGV